MKRLQLSMPTETFPRQKEHYKSRSAIYDSHNRLRSRKFKNVQHALKTIGISSRITDQPSDLEKADGVILPGVGAYGEAMKRLSETGFDLEIIRQAEKRKPLLGICLGMQLLFEKAMNMENTKDWD